MPSPALKSNSPTLKRQEKVLGEFLVPDRHAEDTFIGRLEQGRRELSALLKRDVSVADIAKMARMTGAAISNHKKKGTLPTRENVRALAHVFERAGLLKFSARFLEDGTPTKGVFPQAHPGTRFDPSEGD